MGTKLSVSDPALNILMHVQCDRQRFGQQWTSGVLILTEEAVLFLRGPAPYTRVEWGSATRRLLSVTWEKQGFFRSTSFLRLETSHARVEVFRITEGPPVDKVVQIIQNQMPQHPTQQVRIPRQSRIQVQIDPGVVEYLTAPPQSHIRKVNVIWAKNPLEEVAGQLVLTRHFLVLYTGYMETVTIRWARALVAITGISLTPQTEYPWQDQLEVRLQFGGDVVFTIVPGNGVNGRHLVDRVQESLDRRTRSGSSLQGGQAARFVKPSEVHADLNAHLVSAINAFRTSALVSYQTLLEFTQSRFGTSQGDVKARLAQLITQGSLPGHLTQQGYVRDLTLTFHCQVCDQQVINPLEYWQCGTCYRFVCSSCAQEHTKCPTHPETPTILQRLPVTCIHCGVPIGDLQQVMDDVCPHCQQPIPPIGETTA